MNLLKLSWKYLTAKPLATLLSVVLVALGVSLTSILFLLNKQFQDRLYKNIEGIDLVVSAKGSPLQMLLSSVYHVQVATGKIPLKESFVVTKNPYVAKAIPLTMGDSYKGYRIIGTDSQYVSHFHGKLAAGRWIENDLEVLVGSRCANKLNLKLGDTFYGSHGLVEGGGDVHKTYAYEVVGLLEETNRVIDQLIVTNIASTWRMHEGHDHDGEDEHDHGAAEEEQHEHDHEATEEQQHGHDHGATEEQQHGHDHGATEEEQHGHDHGATEEEQHGHDHGAAEEQQHDHGHDHGATGHQKSTKKLEPISPKGKYISAYLVAYKKDRSGHTSARAFIECANIIDEHSQSMGYAKPSIELQRLLEMTGIGMDFLALLAMIIILISAFSMFISLYASLKDRKYEIALMRVGGASRAKLFLMIILEGVLIAILGIIIGLFFSHLGMQMMAAGLEENYRYTFTGFLFLTEEIYLVLGTLVIGFLAAVLPALQAYRVDISTTLSNS